MFFSKRNRIIKKAVKKTVSDFADRTPKIYEHFFYGAFCGGTEEDQQNILNSLTYRKAMISFTTKEDIDNKANGDYHLYFQ